MELFLDVLGESLVDTAKMLPFLFLAYLLIEYIETRHGERIEALLAGGGRWGAIPGACWAVCRSAAFRPLRPTSTPPASSRWAP
mgnify:CR=1 FL=1